MWVTSHQTIVGAIFRANDLTSLPTSQPSIYIHMYLFGILYITLDMLEEARKLTSSREILLWMTPSEAPKALQASECSELLDPMRASCWISAQH